MEIKMKYLFVLLAAFCLNAFAQDAIETPGSFNAMVTQDNIRTTICVPGWTKTIRPSSYYISKLKQGHLSGKLGNGVYKSSVAAAMFDQDHRVSLGVGGDPKDPKNLWPQLWQGAKANAKDKDVIERAVQKLVCSGKLTLQEGREVFMGDYFEWWIDYKALQIAINISNK